MKSKEIAKHYSLQGKLSDYESATYQECPRCLFTSDIAKMPVTYTERSVSTNINHGTLYHPGQCEYCDLQDALRNQAREPWDKVLERIKKKGKGRKYDALVGISGGEDSSVLLYLATQVWKLRVLAFHINNRTNRPQATNNIQILRDRLNINFYEYYPALQEYDDLTDSLLKAGTPDCDIANDIHMSRLNFKLAKDNGIRVMLNGHSFREEGSSPKAWSFLDTTYLLDIYKKFTGKDLQYYDTLSLWDQVHAGLLGMERISPYHYADHDREIILKVLKSWGWQKYPHKHGENGYTCFVGNYVLPRKFKIDKRRTYLSASIREGRMTKEYAREILETPLEFDTKELGERESHLLHLVNSSPIRPRSDYKQTNYKRIRPLLWILVKLKVFPLSAYNKYAK